MTKLKFDDWDNSDQLFANNDAHLAFQEFDNKDIFNDKKYGKMLFELQKSYNGDKRFILDNRFESDFDISEVNKDLLNKLNKEDYNNLETNNNGIVEHKDFDKEIQNNIDLLSTILPSKKIIKKKIEYNLKKFDPKKASCNNLIIKEDPKYSKSTIKNDIFKMKKGIDIKRLKIEKGKEILDKKINFKEPKHEKNITIDMEALKSSKDLNNFTLFN